MKDSDLGRHSTHSITEGAGPGVTLCCPGRNTASGLASGCPRCGGPFCSPLPPSPRGLSRAPCHRGVCGGRAEGGCAGRVHQRRGPSARAAGRLLAGRGREARVQARLRSPSRRAGLPWGTPLRRPASAGACERVHRRGEGRGGSEGVSLLSRARDAIIPLSPGGDSRGTPRAVLPYPRFFPPWASRLEGGRRGCKCRASNMLQAIEAGLFLPFAGEAAGDPQFSGASRAVPS